MSARRGLALIAGATAVAGLGGYLVTTIAFRGLGSSDYSVFAVFWGALYLVVGALAGFQQEFSRAAHPAGSTAPVVDGPRTRLRPFLLVSAGIVAGVLLVAVALGTPAVFPAHGWELAVPLVVGAVVYVVVSALTGVLYGVSAWGPLAVVIVGDVALRGIAFVVVLSAGGDLVALAWATVIPFPLIVVVLVAFVRSPSRTFVLDVRARALGENSFRTVVAGIGASLLVSGFPVVIGLAGGAGSSVGVLVYVLVLARAPLVVGTLALQSYFVVMFRRRTDRLRVVLLACLAVTGVGVVVAAAAWAWGAPLIELLTGEEYTAEPVLPAALVLASITTAWLAITGAGVLSASDHAGYAAGWTLAAVVAVVVLFALPGELWVRVAVALSAGPVVGAALQLVRLVGRRQQPATDEDG
jgi:O-antigen/teichoic acid export membrane protein